MKDHYKLLGVSQNFTTDELRSRYLFLVKAWHPDLFQDPFEKIIATEVLQDLNAAFAVLNNPQKRMYYDRERRARIILGDLEPDEADPGDANQQKTTPENERGQAEAHRKHEARAAWEKMRTEVIWRQWAEAERIRDERSDDNGRDSVLVFILFLALILIFGFYFIGPLLPW